MCVCVFSNASLEKPWYRAHDSEANNTLARRAFESVLTVTLRRPDSDEHRAFASEVQRRAKDMQGYDVYTPGEEVCMQLSIEMLSIKLCTLCVVYSRSTRAAKRVVVKLAREPIVARKVAYCRVTHVARANVNSWICLRVIVRVKSSRPAHAVDINRNSLVYVVSRRHVYLCLWMCAPGASCSVNVTSLPEETAYAQQTRFICITYTWPGGCSNYFGW